MNAADPLDFLFSLERLGMKFGLENMRRLSASLDHPQHSFRAVTIGGTNGKGSVAAFLEAMLRSAGYRTGRYTSPHLVRLEERFVVNGRETDTPALRDAVGHVQHAVEALLADRVIAAPPTFFECATAAALELFRTQSVEIAVLEVGLGGRLDATTIVTPVCAAITSIGLDHQAQLGDTIESIAWEKAGIAKPAVPLVCGRVPAHADRVIARVCAERGAPLRRVADRVRVRVHRPLSPPLVSFHTDGRALNEVALALDGQHQIDNAAVALEVADALATVGIEISDAAVRDGLSTAQWPGRLERTTWREAEILLDAAHNPAGARALASYLEALGWDAVTLVFGAMRDKDVDAMLVEMARLCRTIVFTTPATPRAMPASELASRAAALPGAVEVIVEPDPEAAIARAAVPGARVVVAGSLFLIGPLRGILR
jgi:dihydrofolate synthase / folylpolyglutamate synthase